MANFTGPLGVPMVADHVAQEVVKRYLCRIAEHCWDPVGLAI